MAGRPISENDQQQSASSVDRNAQLGVGTRFLTALLKLTFRVFRGGRLVVAAIGRRVAAVAAGSVAMIGRLYVGVRWIVLKAIAVAGFLARSLGAVMIGLGGVIAKAVRILAAPARAVGRVATGTIARLAAGFAARRQSVVAHVASTTVRVAAWLATVVYAFAPLGRRLRELPAKRIIPRFAHAGQRMVHSMRVARMKAVLETSASSPPPVASAPALPSQEDVDEGLRFRLSVDQNECLGRAGTQVDAIITVTATRAPHSEDVRRRSPDRAEVILIDCSGSMAYPMSRLRAAQAATGAAIDALHDGTWFALVRANHAAAAVYPSRGLVQAGARTRAEAKQAVKLLWPEGGTAMGKWLLLARDLLATRPGAIAHATLLTDGRNESETRIALDASLTACAGLFQCDCRGVGTDWEVSELRTIASALLGTVDIVPQPTDLAADFRSMTRSSMGKLTGSVALRVWTPMGATLRAVMQVSPTILDLTGRRTQIDTLTFEYPIGAWGEESRRYHVSIRVPAKATGDEMLAARVSVVVGRRSVKEALVKAIWTDDPDRSTPVNPEVGHYTGQAELAQAIQDGLNAQKAGDEPDATLKLGRAVQLAAESNDHDTMKLLLTVLDIDDAATGSVRLKTNVAQQDEMTLDTRSTKTVGVRRGRNPRRSSN